MAMIPIRTSIPIIYLFFCALILVTPVHAQPSAYLDKTLSTPDLTQTDPHGHFADGGINYCAPVAVSDSFIWLTEHGYPNLLPTSSASAQILTPGEKLFNSQIMLARILSSPEFMNTKGQEGTEVDEVLAGVKHYVLKQGYSIKRLEYQGFRSISPEFDGGLRHPRLAWLKEGIIGKSAVWLNLGWYQYISQSNTYVRMGGHWVTLVGYGVDENNQPANNVLIIHNPSPRAGLTFHNDFCRLQPIDGVLVSRKVLLGFPRPGMGFYKIVSGLPAIPKCDTAILEGAIVLELY